MEDEKTTDAAKEGPLEAILGTAREAVDGTETDLKTIVEAFGDRAFGPVMILCSLFLMTPIGAIPGLPAAFGLIIIVFALQLLFRRETPWMPDVLRRICLLYTSPSPRDQRGSRMPSSA